VLEPKLNSICCRSNLYPGQLGGSNNRPTFFFWSTHWTATIFLYSSGCDSPRACHFRNYADLLILLMRLLRFGNLCSGQQCPAGTFKRERADPFGWKQRSFRNSWCPYTSFTKEAIYYRIFCSRL